MRENRAATDEVLDRSRREDRPNLRFFRVTVQTVRQEESVEIGQPLEELGPR